MDVLKVILYSYHLFQFFCCHLSSMSSSLWRHWWENAAFRSKFWRLSHYSDTYLRSKKILLLVGNKYLLFLPNVNLFGPEIRVDEIRQVSKIWLTACLILNEYYLGPQWESIDLQGKTIQLLFSIFFKVSNVEYFSNFVFLFISF